MTSMEQANFRLESGGDCETKRVTFQGTYKDEAELSKMYSRENSLELNQDSSTSRPDFFRQKSIQENDENEKRLGKDAGGECQKLLTQETVIVKSSQGCLRRQKSVTSSGSASDTTSNQSTAKSRAQNFQRSESWIESVQTFLHNKTNDLGTVKAWVKILACCTCCCLLLILLLGGSLLYLYLNGYITTEKSANDPEKVDDPFFLQMKSFEEARNKAIEKHPLDSYQFHMNQSASSAAREIIWVAQQGFENTSVFPTTKGCVTSQVGGRFIGFATVAFKYNTDTTKLTMTVSAVVNPATGDERHLNKVSEPIPNKMVREDYFTSKPVQITFSETLVAGDQICIRAEWDQVKVSYIDNTLTLIRY